MSSALEQQAAFSAKQSCRVPGWLLSAASATSTQEQPHQANTVCGCLTHLWGEEKSLTLAAHPALSLFCPAASTTKHLNPRVSCSKPELYEPKNLLQTPVPKRRGLDPHLGSAHKHPNSSECQVHGSTCYFLSSPLPRLTRESSAIAPSTGHSLKANF